MRETPSFLRPSAGSSDHLLDVLVRARASGCAQRVRAAEHAIVLEHLNVAARAAARHRGRGVDPEDLVQVARLGLVKAVSGWHPQPGGGFLQYALPVVDGEVQRHVRDRAAPIRPPRRVYELRPLLVEARHVLERTGQVCSPLALAEEAGVDVDDAREHLMSYVRSHPESIDAMVDVHDHPHLACGVSDRARDLVEDRLGLRAAIRGLTDRQRRVVALRFFEDRSQQEIAREVGVSQMQISRLLTQVSASLRSALGEGCSEARQVS